MGYSLWNDRIVADSEVVVNKEDRGYQFGDGVYEVVKVYNGQLFTVEEHVERFYASAEKIRITIPYTKDKLYMLLNELVEKNEINTGHIYFQITRGACPRNHIFPGDDVAPVLTGNAKENPRPVANFENGVKAIFDEDIRWLRCDIKSLNLLGAVLSKQKAHEANAYEAILHRGETITEGSSSNIYGVKDGVLYTHPANNLILNGITRQVILNCAAEIGMPVKEQPMTKTELLAMDEVIVSSTTSEVTPIIEIEGAKVGAGVPGEWTRKLQAQFETKIPQPIQA
ncbi:MAG: D-amino-acid transaminase [Solibacillus sp.]